MMRAAGARRVPKTRPCCRQTKNAPETSALARRASGSRRSASSPILLDLLKRQRIEIRGRVEPMTVLTAEDPTVLAGLIDPPGETSETELEVA